jgi:hypothetical protein
VGDLFAQFKSVVILVLILLRHKRNRVAVVGALTDSVDIARGFRERDGEAFSGRRDRVSDMAFGTDRRRLGVDNRRVGEASCAAGRLRGNRVPFRDQESVSGDAERGMMVKATPTSTFVMAQAECTFDCNHVRYASAALSRCQIEHATNRLARQVHAAATTSRRVCRVDALKARGVLAEVR